MKPANERWDAYPDRAQYRPGEPGHIVVEFNGKLSGPVEITVECSSLHHGVWTRSVQTDGTAEAAQPSGKQRLLVPFTAPDEPWGCYGIDVRIVSEGRVLAELSTAFDVADHWRRAPRYGFLSDFKAKELGCLTDVESLNRFHLNVVQFYDWMYRHDDLIPPSDEFVDPMGRTLSYPVIQEKISALHRTGMAAMAYGAVYGALKDFLDRHPDWGLYQRNGQPFQLIDIFYLMDISPDSPWSEHIVDQFRRAVEAGFDGIHMDQYGFPKKALRRTNGQEEEVDLAECYAALIDRTKEALLPVHPEVGLIFNNVSNYPVHATAAAAQDAVYIEVWPPVVRFRELKALIDRGRELGRDKQVILSAYLPSFRKKDVEPAWAENGALLTMATIFASGGYHLLLGEEESVLTAAYYPDYVRMRPSFVREVRRYYDFIVRYGRLLYDLTLLDVSMTYTGGINGEITFHGKAPFEPNGNPGTVWTQVKQMKGYTIIHLINLVGLEDDYWEYGKRSRPEPQHNIECRVLMEREVRGIYLASPDRPSGKPERLAYERVDHSQGYALKFSVPELNIWSMVYIEWADNDEKSS